MEAKTKSASKEKTAKTPKAAKTGSGKSPIKVPAGNTDGRAYNGYTLSKKRSGRWEVIGPNGEHVNGEAKAKILVEADLVKVLKAKSKDAAPAAEAKAEG
jgi:hypothetical protein